MFDKVQVRDHFDKNITKWREVSLLRLVQSYKEEIEQSLADIKTEEQDFKQVATARTIEQSARRSDAFIGTMRCTNLNPKVAETIRNASSGEIIGPFHESGYWTAYQIVSYNEPQLDERRFNVLQNELFNNWLAQAVCKAQA